jgi:hypothetical protein
MFNCRLSFSDTPSGGIYKKQLREAQPPITNDNRTLNNEQFLHTFYERAFFWNHEKRAVIDRAYSSLSRIVANQRHVVGSTACEGLFFWRWWC